MPCCCIKPCGARRNKNHPTLTLHKFPKNEAMKQKWLEIIGTGNINPRHKMWFVCSLHFPETAFNRTLDCIRLHDGAMPLPLTQVPSNTSKPEFKFEIRPNVTANHDASIVMIPDNTSAQEFSKTHTVVNIIQDQSIAKIQKQNEDLRDKCLLLMKKVKSLKGKVKRRDRNIAFYSEIVEELHKNK